MKLISRIAHLSVVVAMLLLTLAAALPAARADNGQPPVIPNADKGTPSAPSSTPTASLPNQPAGAVPPPPPGCGFTEADYIGFLPAGPHAIPDFSGVPGVITSTMHISTPKHYLWDVNVTTNITHT